LGNLDPEFLIDALGQSRPLRAVNAEGVKRREEQVMHLVADGLGNREIAERLNLSEHTVKNYVFHILEVPAPVAESEIGGSSFSVRARTESLDPRPMAET
jgi:DNA-binding CsgD family transcriptional regulator